MDVPKNGKISLPRLVRLYIAPFVSTVPTDSPEPSTSNNSHGEQL